MICVHCYAEFEPDPRKHGKPSRTCSRQCSQAYYRAHVSDDQREKRNAVRRKSETTRVCPHCFASFVAKGKRTYCPDCSGAAKVANDRRNAKRRRASLAKPRKAPKPAAPRVSKPKVEANPSWWRKYKVEPKAHPPRNTPRSSAAKRELEAVKRVVLEAYAKADADMQRIIRSCNPDIWGKA